jgi:hypothetical protein
MKSINLTFDESQSCFTFELDMTEGVVRPWDPSDPRDPGAAPPTALIALTTLTAVAKPSWRCVQSALLATAMNEAHRNPTLSGLTESNSAFVSVQTEINIWSKLASS